MRRNSLCLMLLFVVMAIGCDDGELVQLQRDVKDLQSRVTTLETWCNTANTQICALQGLGHCIRAKRLCDRRYPDCGKFKRSGLHYFFQ